MPGLSPPNRENRRRKARLRSRLAAASNGTLLLASNGSCEYRGQYTSREVGETTHHGQSTLSLDLNKRLTLDVSGIWDRISDPKVGADGIQPKPDDFRLVLGLGVHF